MGIFNPANTHPLDRALTGKSITRSIETSYTTAKGVMSTVHKINYNTCYKNDMFNHAGAI